MPSVGGVPVMVGAILTLVTKIENAGSVAVPLSSVTEISIAL